MSVELPLEAYLSALASLDNVGPATFRWLLSHGSPRRVWDRVQRGQLVTGPGARISRDQIRSWVDQAAATDPRELWQHCEEVGIGVVSLGGPGYPSRLADDIDPPVVLFTAGDLDRVSERRVAIVGTRRPTRYGLEVARGLAYQLTLAGVSVVSGLALGIDAAAHQGAVDAIRGIGEGGQGYRSVDSRSVDSRCVDRGHVDHSHVGRAELARVLPNGPLAVVGANLESPCPKRNLLLAKAVSETGIILSEVPPGTASAPWRFPVRNRVLAALSEVLVVVESAANGGSMHTVREALDRNRTVMAVPGPIGTASSDGTNELIRDGAVPCLGVSDVLAELGLANVETHKVEASGSEEVSPQGVLNGPGPVPRDLSESDALVLESIGWRPVTFEGLAAASNVSPRQLAVAISSLEQSGWISRSGVWIERRR